MPKPKRYQVWSPDDLLIGPGLHRDLNAAQAAVRAFIERYRTQGFYKTSQGIYIPVDQLGHFIKIEPV